MRARSTAANAPATVASPGPDGWAARFVPVRTWNPPSGFPARSAAKRFAASGFENDALVQITCNWERRNRSVNVEVIQGETATAAIDFPPGTATLEGHIRREEGAPAEVATLSLMLSSPFGDESFHVESDPEGNYQLDALPAGSYEVLIRIGEGIPVKFAEPLEIEDGAAVVRDFNVAEGTPIGTPTGGEAVQIVVPLIR